MPYPYIAGAVILEKPINLSLFGVCLTRHILPLNPKGDNASHISAKLTSDVKPHSFKDVFGAPCRYIAPHQLINLSDGDQTVAVISRDDPDEQESTVLYEQEVK